MEITLNTNEVYTHFISCSAASLKFLLKSKNLNFIKVMTDT